MHGERRATRVEPTTTTTYVHRRRCVRTPCDTERFEITGREPVNHPDDQRRFHGAHGGAAVVVLIVTAVLALLVLDAVGDFGHTTLQRAQAQSAADASALAGLDGGRAASASIAARNGGVLVRWQRGPGTGEVTVVVRFGEITAVARASDAE